MAPPLGEEVDISGAKDKEYDGGGFEDPFAFTDLLGGTATTGEEDQGGENQGGEDQGQGTDDKQQTGDQDGQTAQGGEEATGGEQTQKKAEEGQAGDEGNVPAEPPEDPAFEDLKRMRQELDQARTAMMQMQAQMQQVMQAAMPQANQQAQQRQAAPPQDKPPSIDLDDIDMPSEQDWAENPSEAAKKINAQVARKVAEAVERGVSEKVMGNLTERERIRAQQQQSFRSAASLYPDAANNPAVLQTAEEILANPANADLRKMPMGPFFAIAAAASVHGISPVTAQQQGMQQGMQQGAQAERSRQNRLRTGAMNTGGKEGQSTISLDPTQKRIAKQMGISEKAYAEGLEATKGGA